MEVVGYSIDGSIEKRGRNELSRSHTWQRLIGWIHTVKEGMQLRNRYQSEVFLGGHSDSL